jgi:hypothetical protein
MQRSLKISEIINQRRPLAKKVEEVEENLRAISSGLAELERHRSQLISQVDDSAILNQLKEINFLEIQSNINFEIGSLSKLKMRFSRDALNIGVVGRARQGKSRLLQSLSGLTSSEIPSGDRSHCTGVRSTIYHLPNSETYAEVFFHTEHSFLEEVINPYYERLRLGSKPLSSDTFASQALPKLPESFLGNATSSTMYEHLIKYHKHYKQYSHLLRQQSPLRISKDNIREYVAQDTTTGERTFFNYLAVQEVRIFCSFPNEDIGKVALIDMPGLGDTGLGDEERLIKTLGQDVDIVLFVRMPKPMGDIWAEVDVQLYDKANSALTEIPIYLWSYMILNSIQANVSNNTIQCEELQRTIDINHIKVVDCITADCSNAQEANIKILDNILNYLEKNIVSLDCQYISACQDRLVRLQHLIFTELNKAKNVLGGDSRKIEGWYATFLSLFNTLWLDLTTGLARLLRELRSQRDIQDEDFEAQVERVIALCREDAAIPSLQEIEKRRDSVNSYGIAYDEYLNEIRAHLSRHFLTLDDGLKRSLEHIKSEVSEVLIEKGRLGFLTTAKGSTFLSEMNAQMPDDLHELKFGFEVLASFELSYRGLVQHRIRRHLDRLTPDAKPLRLSDNPSAEEILDNLQTLHAEALYECENALEELLCEPSQAAYAIVEEFLDRILRAKGSQDEWQNFLAEVRAEIWPDEFEKLGEKSRQRREWSNNVERVEKIINSRSLSLID